MVLGSTLSSRLDSSVCTVNRGLLFSTLWSARLQWLVACALVLDDQHMPCRRDMRRTCSENSRGCGFEQDFNITTQTLTLGMRHALRHPAVGAASSGIDYASPGDSGLHASSTVAPHTSCHSCKSKLSQRVHGNDSPPSQAKAESQDGNAAQISSPPCSLTSTSRLA